jgi:hypothetical protein
MSHRHRPERDLHLGGERDEQHAGDDDGEAAGGAQGRNYLLSIVIIAFDAPLWISAVVESI